MVQADSTHSLPKIACQVVSRACLRACMPCLAALRPRTSLCSMPAQGGDMFHYTKRRGGVHEHEARWFFQQLIIGLDYCHRMGVVNRDIKLENTLLDGSKRPLVKICDFGYSKSEKDSLPKSKVGTPGYTGEPLLRTQLVPFCTLVHFRGCNTLKHSKL